MANMKPLPAFLLVIYVLVGTVVVITGISNETMSTVIGGGLFMVFGITLFILNRKDK